MFHYRLADESVLRLLDTLHNLAGRQLAEVDRLVTVLDVRPTEEYAAGHLKEGYPEWKLRGYPVATKPTGVGTLK